MLSRHLPARRASSIALAVLLSGLPALAAAADVPLDMTRGTSILLIHDCNDERSPGVHFGIEVLDPDSTPLPRS